MKTTIDVDREAAREAADLLGTRTLKETVNRSLREIVRAEHRRRLAEEILAGTLPVPSLEEVARLREPKLPVGALDDFLDREN